MLIITKDTNMENSWVKLHRESLKHWLYNENRPHTRREAWEDMLLLCNHSDEKVLIDGVLFDCKRGQSVKSMNSWANEFKWSIQQVKTFFRILRGEGMIETEGLRKSTRVTICNYEIYQDQQPADNLEKTSTQPADNFEITTNKNVKNKEEYISSDKSSEINPSVETPENLKPVKKFVPPTFEEAKDYFAIKLRDNNLPVDANIITTKFINYYTANGWMVGKNKMKDWKAAISGTWITGLKEKQQFENKQQQQQPIRIKLDANPIRTR